MNRFLIITMAALFAFTSGAAFAQPLRTVTTDGCSVVTELGYGIKINKNSSLRRTLVVINDPNCPVQLDAAGINTEYSDRSYSYRPTGTAKATENLSAIEIRYLLFDMFGNHIKTLSGTEVADVASGASIQLKEIGSWRAWEIEVSKLLTIVSFVGNARTANGRVWKYREKPISEELNKIRLSVTSGVLDPTKDGK